uniref:Uncharacterized protein n=1 Tax=viral metagenome TaxID=1070528 RepID=A0A6C0CNC8_9ZZZZ
MDISASMIDLHFLTNFHDKKKLGLEEKENVSRKDLLKYRKEILQLTKNMLRGYKTEECINDSFDNYIKQCIQHFKFLEMSNAIQNEYKPVDVPDSKKEPPKKINLQQINETMLKPKKINTIKITDKLNIKKKKKKENTIILPKKRNK